MIENAKMEIKTEYAIGIKRVSSTKQGLMGDSPEDQKNQMIRRGENLSAILNSKIVFKKYFDFTESASGELDMQPILKALEYCKNPQNKIKYAFIKSIDRGTRGGATIYGLLKAQFARYGVQFVDVYGVIGTQNVNTLDHLGVKYKWSEFSPTFITELLEAERGKSEVRDILTRMIGAEIRYVRMGYRVRPAPPGYKNIKIETPNGMRVVLAPHDTEAKWFIRMFELRIQGNMSDLEIVNEINRMGYKSRRQRIHDPIDKTKTIGYKGEKPLTVKQLQRYIQNPIYAGINTEKWTEGKPIKEKSNGLIPIDIFNKANRGKITIVEDNNTVIIFKGEVPSWKLKKLKDNPLYPYRKYVLCPQCQKPFLGSAPKGEHGTRHPTYHCSRNHKYVGIPVDKFHRTIESFVKNVEFTEKDFIKFRKKVLYVWEQREKNASDDVITSSQRAIQIEQEIQGLKETIKRLTSTATIKLFENDIEKLEQEKTQVIIEREKNEKEEVDTQVIVNYIKFFMERFEDLLLGGSNPVKNAAIFGLLFDELPTYQDLINGTVKLACLFKLKDSLEISNFQSVSREFLTSHHF